MTATAVARRTAIPGPNGSQAALSLAMMLRDPLAGYLSLSARYGDAIRPGRVQHRPDERGRAA
jgi:hypothetical protein